MAKKTDSAQTQNTAQPTDDAIPSTLRDGESTPPPPSPPADAVPVMNDRPFSAEVQAPRVNSEDGIDRPALFTTGEWYEITDEHEPGLREPRERAHRILRAGEVSVELFHPAHYPDLAGVVYCWKTWDRGVVTLMTADHMRQLATAVESADAVRAAKVAALEAQQLAVQQLETAR